MERLMQRVGLAQKAIGKLLELSCKKDYTEIERDALIQRFEFSYEQETKLALQMSDDRNLTVHAYDEAFAEVLAGRISGYAVFLQAWLERMAEDMHFSE